MYIYIYIYIYIHTLMCFLSCLPLSENSPNQENDEPQGPQANESGSQALFGLHILVYVCMCVLHVFMCVLHNIVCMYVCMYVHCIVWYCFALYCLVLFGIVLFCIWLYCIVLYCTYTRKRAHTNTHTERERERERERGTHINIMLRALVSRHTEACTHSYTCTLQTPAKCISHATQGTWRGFLLLVLYVKVARAMKEPVPNMS